MVAAAIGAVIGGATSLIAGQQQANAAKKSARLQAAAAQQARADLQPFRETGVNALTDLSTLLGLGGTPEAQTNALNALTASPGFRFRLGQGVNALDQSAVARGGLLSGNQLKAVNEFGQGLASQEFANRFNQLSALANQGQSAAVGQGGISQTGASRQGDALRAAGGARAVGTMGFGNALAGLLGSGLFQGAPQPLASTANIRVPGLGHGFTGANGQIAGRT